MMGYYSNGRYVYEPMDAGNGVCDEADYTRQRQLAEKLRKENNANESDEEFEGRE